MKRIALTISGIALAGLPLVQAAQAEVNVNVNVGVPAPVVPVPVVPPPPVGVPGPPAITLSVAPDFIYPSALGFYVAVGVPYDIFYVGNSYYLCRDGYWYRAPYYNGPWRNVKHKHLPPGLRRYDIDKIRYHRDHEYRSYRDDHDHYRGRHFRPDKEWKEDRKERHREEKEHRKGEGHGHGKHGGRD